MQRDMDRMYDIFSPAISRASALAQRGSKWYPSVDMYEKEGRVVVSAELPGIPKENVNVDIKDNILTISGENQVSKEFDEGTAHVKERSYGKFYRQLSLPDGTEGEKATAKFENGILQVCAPKAKGLAKKISVQ
jgi:HSP20 family protein